MPKSLNPPEQQLIQAELIKKMKRRKKVGRFLKSSWKDPKFLKNMDKPNIFCILPKS
jgi:hypothetical protein